MSHFLQSDHWAALQEALGRERVADSGPGFSYQGFIETGKINKRLYVPYGPEIESVAGLTNAVSSLRQRAKEHNAAFVRLEPQGPLSQTELEAEGLLRVDRVQPEHTQRVRLDRPFEEVLLGMSKSQRNLHRNHAKKGISVVRSEDPGDVEILLRFLRGVAGQTGMHAHSEDYLRTQARVLIPRGAASIYLAKLDGEPVAASLIYDDAERRYYAHAAADYAHRNLSPGVVLVTRMMQDAAEVGIPEFDLYGVVPPDVTDHAWSGFSKFKRSFGGTQHDFLGTWEFPVKRASYRLYRLLRKAVDGRS